MSELILTFAIILAFAIGRASGVILALGVGDPYRGDRQTQTFDAVAANPPFEPFDAEWLEDADDFDAPPVDNPDSKD